MKIFLCGLPKVGKTFFGQLVAERSGWNLLDLDRLIEQLYEKETSTSLSIRELFKKEGEVYFRQREKQAIETLMQTKDNQIIALGGGALMDPQNAITVKSIGLLVYLRASNHTIFERLMKQSEIPPYLDKKDPRSSFDLLASKRIAQFEQWADLVIDTHLQDAEKTIECLCAIAKGKMNGK